jgi:hypothetical protein
LYIDDVGIFGEDSLAMEVMMRAYIKKMNSLGLLVKDSKTVWPSKQVVEVLGLEVHGLVGRVHIAMGKQLKLIRDTVIMLKANEVSGYVLAGIIGKWIWNMLLGRISLSIFSNIFKFIAISKGAVFHIWESVKRELYNVINMVPLMRVSLFDEFFDYVVMTDASSKGYGVVVSKLGHASIRNALLLNSEVSGLYYDTDRVYKTIVSSVFNDKYKNEHINVKEMLAIRAALFWFITFKSSMHNKRLLLFTDSYVCLFALMKGRSSSFRLNNIIRSIAIMILSMGIKLTVKYVPSALNRADGPSRGY